jgi:hypothetical protein
MTQDGVERALRALGGVMGIVAHDLKPLFPQKVYVCSVSASIVQHATFDVAEPEELAGREGRAVPFLGRKVGIGIFATRHDG